MDRRWTEHLELISSVDSGRLAAFLAPRCRVATFWMIWEAARNTYVILLSKLECVARPRCRSVRSSFGAMDQTGVGPSA